MQTVEGVTSLVEAPRSRRRAAVHRNEVAPF
jgi:hypothetical protein